MNYRNLTGAPGDIIGTIFSVIDTVSNIASKCESKEPPAPRVEVVSQPAPQVVDRPMPPININLTINVYKGDSTDEPIRVIKTQDGIGVNLK